MLKNKLEYDNPLRKQCYSLPDLVETQIKGVLEGIRDLDIKSEVLAGLSRYYITGSGDSYAASLGVYPIYNHYLGRFGSTITADTPLNISRFTRFDESLLDKTIVIGISCWGFPNRVVEVMRRTNTIGAISLDVTNFPSAPVGQESKHTLMVNTPEFEFMSPGCRDYLGSWIGAALLAIHIAGLKGSIDSDVEIQKLSKAMIEYGNKYKELMEECDDLMFKVADEWKNLSTYEMVGNGTEYPTAFFAQAKIIEIVGKYAIPSNTDDFMRRTSRHKNPKSIGTVFFLDAMNNEADEIITAANYAFKIGRKTMVISNAPEVDEKFSKGIIICHVPKIDVEFKYLQGTLDHIPTSLLSSYISAISGEAYFRDGESGVPDVIGESLWATPGVNTLQTSEIVIVENKKVPDCIYTIDHIGV